MIMHQNVYIYIHPTNVNIISLLSELYPLTWFQSLKLCKYWNASLTAEQLCMGMDERKHEPPPPVIGEEKIDITSLLWKDEDKDMVYVDQRYLVGIYVIKQKLTVLLAYCIF